MPGHQRRARRRPHRVCRRSDRSRCSQRCGTAHVTRYGIFLRRLIATPASPRVAESPRSERMRAKRLAAFLAGADGPKIIVAIDACGMTVGKIDLQGVISDGLRGTRRRARLE